MGLLRRTTWRFYLPATAARRGRRRVRLALDLGRPGKATRRRSRPKVSPHMTSTNMSSDLDDRLERLLGGAQLAPLRLRLRRYFERVDNGTLGDMLRLTQLSAMEHEA